MGCVVVASDQGEVHVGVGCLPASVGNLIAERCRSFDCRGCVELQISSVVYGRDADVGSVRGAYRGDAQHGTVGLFVVAKHVEDLLRARSRAERIVFRFDLPGLRRAGFAEIMLVVGAVVVLFLLLRLFGFHLVPLDFDDFGGFLRIPNIAVDHVVEYDQTMVGAEYQFRSGVDVGQGVECHVRTVGGAYFGVIVGFLRPCGEYASACGYRLGGLALAGIRRFRGFLGVEVHRCEPAWCRHGHPSVLFAVRGRGLQGHAALQIDGCASLRPIHGAFRRHDRGFTDDGERFGMRSASYRANLLTRALRPVNAQHRTIGSAVSVYGSVVRHRDFSTGSQFHFRLVGDWIDGFHIGSGSHPHIAGFDVDERCGVASDNGFDIRFDGGVAGFADCGSRDIAGFRTFGNHGAAIMLGHVETGGCGRDSSVHILVFRIESCCLAVLQRSDPHGAVVKLHMPLRHRTDDERACDDAQQ